jgi:hypothetical protein
MLIKYFRFIVNPIKMPLHNTFCDGLILFIGALLYFFRQI